MVLTALRGALGFLTRLPVGHDEAAWDAFRATPLTLPLAGYLVGVLVALPLAVPLPAPTVGLAFVAWLYLVTGVNHADGVADLGDAMAVHGDAERRRDAMTDTTTGVGAVLALALVAVGVALAGVALAAVPRRLLGLVVAAEVGAKLGLAALACLGTATHEGLGASLTGENRPRSLAAPAVVALPVTAATWPNPAAAASFAGAFGAALAVFLWARRRLGGVSGDVFGASNEVARVVGLHAGVVAWTRF